jgi:hypothetical protein
MDIKIFNSLDLSPKISRYKTSPPNFIDIDDVVYNLNRCGFTEIFGFTNKDIMLESVMAHYSVSSSNPTLTMRTRLYGANVATYSNKTNYILNKSTLVSEENRYEECLISINHFCFLAPISGINISTRDIEGGTGLYVDINLNMSAEVYEKLIPLFNAHKNYLFQVILKPKNSKNSCIDVYKSIVNTIEQLNSYVKITSSRKGDTSKVFIGYAERFQDVSDEIKILNWSGYFRYGSSFKHVVEYLINCGEFSISKGVGSCKAAKTIKPILLGGEKKYCVKGSLNTTLKLKNDFTLERELATEIDYYILDTLLELKQVRDKQEYIVDVYITDKEYYVDDNNKRISFKVLPGIINENRDNKIKVGLSKGYNTTLLASKPYYNIITESDLNKFIKYFEDVIKQTVINIKDIIRNSIKDVYTEDLFDIISKDTFSLDTIIKFEDITIINSMDDEHNIKDLFVNLKYYYGSVFTLEGTRTTFTREEVESGYTHSHLPGGAFSGYSQFCLGATPVSSSIVRLNNLIRMHNVLIVKGEGNTDTYNGVCKELEEQFSFLFYSLGNYVRWESLEGTPYSYISEISERGSGTKLTPYDIDVLQDYHLKDVVNYIYDFLIGINFSNHHTVININNSGRKSLNINLRFTDTFFEEMMQYIMNNEYADEIREVLDGCIGIRKNGDLIYFSSDDENTNIEPASGHIIFKNQKIIRKVINSNNNVSKSQTLEFTEEFKTRFSNYILYNTLNTYKK